MKEENEKRMIIGTGEKIFLVVNNLIMVFLMVITLYPLLYVLFCSLSDPIELGKVSGAYDQARGLQPARVQGSARLR